MVARCSNVGPIDCLIAGFDRALRAVAGAHGARRPSPADAIREAELSADERARSAALMRVNHVGEICAQALYESQTLAARGAHTRDSLLRAVREEGDHLAWCATRIEELGGRRSILSPLWYAGSFAIGAAAGAFGDRWNMAFLAETERQVEEHLTGHLEQLAPEDRRTRTLLETMRTEEARHRETAIRLGAAEMPAPMKLAMRLASKVMTGVSYHL